MYQKHVNYDKKPSVIYVWSVSQLLPIYQTCVAKRGPLLRKVVFFYSANINIFFSTLNCVSFCIQKLYKMYTTNALRKKCPNTELFLVRVFLYSDWIQENTDQK